MITLTPVEFFLALSIWLLSIIAAYILGRTAGAIELLNNWLKDANKIDKNVDKVKEETRSIKKDVDDIKSGVLKNKKGDNK